MGSADDVVLKPLSNQGHQCHWGGVQSSVKQLNKIEQFQGGDHNSTLEKGCLPSLGGKLLPQGGCCS